MKTLQDFINVAEFLGDEMTEEQASRLFDQAKNELSITDIKKLHDNVGGLLYRELSQYNAEMGGLSRY